MSNMENLETELSEKERQARVNEAALASIAAERNRRSASGHAVISSAMGYGSGALGKGVFGRISHAAKLFCILFAFLVPSLLIWQVLL
ncbi:hypothetical protein [Roseobacter sp.]|uniref:hypothetical protein n=1 Tax=Roseobacter sp. TaxID=1907202 RepID=UPI0025E468C6|nr:hypothetical protein [Roseobacter sp.]